MKKWNLNIINWIYAIFHGEDEGTVLLSLNSLQREEFVN
jgi:hypothetical protein